VSKKRTNNRGKKNDVPRPTGATGTTPATVVVVILPESNVAGAQKVAGHTSRFWPAVVHGARAIGARLWDAAWKVAVALLIAWLLSVLNLV